MKVSRADIRRAFNPSNRLNYSESLQLEEACQEVADHVNMGSLIFAREEPTIPDIELAPKSYNESNDHRHLKAVGAYLLRQRGETEIQYESLEFDVYGATMKIRVECGETPVYRLLGSFFSVPPSSLREFWTIPYPYMGEPIKVYKFILNPDYKPPKYDSGIEIIG